MTLSIDNARSYQTPKALARGLEKFGFADHKHMVVCNTQGRYTAIFPVSNFHNTGGYIGIYANKGFILFG